VAEWRYLFADLLNDVTFAEVDISGAQFDSRISSAGSLSGTITVTNSDIAAAVRGALPSRLTGAPSTICHVYRDADLWDSYVIWNVSPTEDRTDETVSIQGATLESWLDRRFTDDLTFTDSDKLTIAQQLVTSCQSGHPAKALGIQVPTGTLGSTVTQSYYLTDQKSVLSAITDLSNADPGFEFRVSGYVDTTTGLRVRSLVFGAPIIGGGPSGMVYEKPGAVQSFGLSTDLTQGGTAFLAVGDSDPNDITANPQPYYSGPLLAQDLLDAGWAWIDYGASFSGVIDQKVLDGRAATLRADRSGYVSIPSMTVVMNDDNLFRPQQLGQTVNSVVQTYLYGLLDLAPRVVGISMQPSGRGSGVDLASFVLADPTAGDSGSN